jgi:hypothetical protein
MSFKINNNKFENRKAIKIIYLHYQSFSIKIVIIRRAKYTLYR